MKRFRIGLLCLAVLGMLACAAAYGEENVPLDKVPQAVKDAAQKAVDGIKLTGAEMETKDSLVIYELEGAVGDKKYEITVSADGKVISVKIDDDNDKDEDKDCKDKDCKGKDCKGKDCDKGDKDCKGGCCKGNKCEMGK